MSEQHDNGPAAGRRRRWMLPVLAAVALVVVAGGVALASGVLEPGQTEAASRTASSPSADAPGEDAASTDTAPGDTDATPAPAPSPDDSATPEPPSTEPLPIEAPTPAPLTDSEEVEVERATDTATVVVDALNTIGQQADGSAVGIEQIATGFVEGEMQAFAQEQLDLGYTQVGDAVITSVTASDVDLAASPAVMTLTVCVDTSGVDVLDAAGNSLKASLYNPGRPVTHIYGAVFVDDVWKISTHDIPEAQDCPIV